MKRIILILVLLNAVLFFLNCEEETAVPDTSPPPPIPGPCIGDGKCYKNSDCCSGYCYESLLTYKRSCTSSSPAYVDYVAIGRIDADRLLVSAVLVSPTPWDIGLRYLNVLLSFSNGSWDVSYSGTFNPTAYSPFTTIWSSATSGILLAGTHGIYQFDANTGSLSQEGSMPEWGINAIWGSEDGPIFAAGTEGRIYVYENETWTLMTTHTTETLRGLWGSPTGKVFAVGDGGLVMEYDSVWTQVRTRGRDGSPVTLTSAWGVSDTSVFVVGASGTILTNQDPNNEGNWILMDSPTEGYLDDIWGSSGSNVYATARDEIIHVGTSEIIHFDGTSWKKLESPLTCTVWVGAGFSAAEVSMPFKDILGSSDTDIWALGGGARWCNGSVFHYDGQAWTDISPDSAFVRDIWVLD